MILVLMSGGIDSTLLAERAYRDGILGAGLFIDYGQPVAKQERRTVRTWANKHLVQLIELPCIISGVEASMQTGVGTDGLRILPGRNLILAAHAVNIAKTRGYEEVWLGANAGDQPYPDCRPTWVDALDTLTQADTGIKVVAPLIELSKATIIREAHEIGMDLEQTWSCYQPTTDGLPCGSCHSCHERTEVDGV
tara:strand:+ start:2789 stop:3370 length:582 start_codon:yes stop_codon:yes gene_type:complete